MIPITYRLPILVFGLAGLSFLFHTGSAGAYLEARLPSGHKGGVLLASLDTHDSGGGVRTREHREDTHEGHDDAGHAHEGEDRSDLDRSVDEMWKARCEHDRLQYSCDECRFGLGVVKLDASLFGEKGNPGLVSATTVQAASFTESRVFHGEVRRNEGKTVRVVSPVPGVVVAVEADIGKAVAKGDLLFEIDSHEIFEAKAEYQKRIAARNLARSTADREARLFEKKISAEVEVIEARSRLAEAEVDVANARFRLIRLGIPEDELEALAGGNNGAMTGRLFVKAPLGGVILEKRLSVGERVASGQDVITVSDLSEVWIWTVLREGDLPAVSRGSNGGRIPAEVRGPGGKIHRGYMDVLSGTMDEKTRTVGARVVVANPGGELRPGMFVTVRFLLPGGRKVLAVPKVAVLSDEGRPFVFVHREGEYWIRRSVTLGRRLGDRVEVQGLPAGQRIIADGSFLLKSDVLRKKMGAGCAD